MLKVKNIHKRFGKTQVLQDVSFEVSKGEILSLTGESGCGKSTLLRIIGGLETADEGSIHLEGTDITNLRPEQRKFGFVFQNLSLFPHLSVQENIQFALKRKEKDEKKLKELLAMTGMSGLEKRYPHELSGGQQQRVALARALSIDPKILILDEPFSSLDELLKTKIREEIFSLLNELNITTIMVSHQADDSFLIADRLIVMKKGQILQEGAPIEIYQKPISEYVSNLFGASVIIDAIKKENQAITAFGNLPVTGINDTFRLCIRPENILVSTEHDTNISGIVKSKHFKGPHDVLTIQAVSTSETFSFETERIPHEIGSTIYLKVPEEKIIVF